MNLFKQLNDLICNIVVAIEVGLTECSSFKSVDVNNALLYSPINVLFALHHIVLVANVASSRGVYLM